MESKLSQAAIYELRGLTLIAEGIASLAGLDETKGRVDRKNLERTKRLLSNLFRMERLRRAFSLVDGMVSGMDNPVRKLTNLKRLLAV